MLTADEELPPAEVADITGTTKPARQAAELTDRDKVAIAIAAGVPTRTYMGDNLRLTVETLQPIGIADRGDGGYIVATLKA